jgi:hypothetical protein
LSLNFGSILLASQNLLLFGKNKRGLWLLEVISILSLLYCIGGARFFESDEVTPQPKWHLIFGSSGLTFVPALLITLRG